MANRPELQRTFTPKDHALKGISRVIRTNKRHEAEQRNRRTPIERTKRYRQGKIHT